MKKIWGILAVVLLLLTVYFCFIDGNIPKETAVDLIREKIEEDPSLYPVYNRSTAEEKELYLKICAAAENFDQSITNVYQSESKRGITNYLEEFSIFYREVVYEQPEYFWVDPYNYESYVSVDANGVHTLTVDPVYLLDEEEANEMKADYEQAVDKIVSVAKSKPTTYDKVLYVHDYILANCVYDTDAYERGDFKSPSINAYGCLVEGKAICSGYTMAFNAVMRNLGFECGSEFSAYNGFSIFSEGHVWNYCNLDGDYYYFDLTWDDMDPNGDFYKYFPYNHSYFGITTEELTAAHLTLSGQAKTPRCTGTKYNYFVYNNRNFDVYNYELVKASILSQAGNKFIELRFGSYFEALTAQRDLITNQKIFELLPEQNGVEYYISKSNHQLFILLKDE